jgi:LysM repeat protein
MAVLHPSTFPLAGVRGWTVPVRIPPVPRRVILWAVVGITAVALTWLALTRPAATDVRPASMAPTVAESAAYPAWTVAPGDTLWSIARTVAPEADPRAVVLQLQVLNAFGPDHVLQVGEVLQMPVSGPPTR